MSVESVTQPAMRDEGIEVAVAAEQMVVIDDAAGGNQRRSLPVRKAVGTHLIEATLPFDRAPQLPYPSLPGEAGARPQPVLDNLALVRRPVSAMPSAIGSSSISIVVRAMRTFSPSATHCGMPPARQSPC